METKKKILIICEVLFLFYLTIGCSSKLSGTYVSDKGNHIFYIKGDSSFQYERIFGTSYSHSEGYLKKISNNRVIIKSNKLSLVVPMKIFKYKEYNKNNNIDVIVDIEMKKNIKELTYYYLIFNDTSFHGPYKCSVDKIQIRKLENIKNVKVKIFADEGLTMIAGDTLYTEKQFFSLPFDTLKIMIKLDKSSFRYKIFSGDTLIFKRNRFLYYKPLGRFIKDNGTG